MMNKAIQEQWTVPIRIDAHECHHNHSVVVVSPGYLPTYGVWWCLEYYHSMPDLT